MIIIKNLTELAGKRLSDVVITDPAIVYHYLRLVHPTQEIDLSAPEIDYLVKEIVFFKPRSLTLLDLIGSGFQLSVDGKERADIELQFEFLGMANNRNSEFLTHPFDTMGILTITNTTTRQRLYVSELNAFVFVNLDGNEPIKTTLVGGDDQADYFSSGLYTNHFIHVHMDVNRSDIVYERPLVSRSTGVYTYFNDTHKGFLKPIRWSNERGSLEYVIRPEDKDFLIHRTFTAMEDISSLYKYSIADYHYEFTLIQPKDISNQRLRKEIDLFVKIPIIQAIFKRKDAGEVVKVQRKDNTGFLLEEWYEASIGPGQPFIRFYDSIQVDVITNYHSKGIRYRVSGEMIKGSTEIVNGESCAFTVESSQGDNRLHTYQLLPNFAKDKAKEKAKFTVVK